MAEFLPKRLRRWHLHKSPLKNISISQQETRLFEGVRSTFKKKL